MLDNRTINALSERISELLPPAMRQVKSDFDARLKVLLQQQLAQLEMVGREEFEIQQRVLARTREKLEALERRLAELEKERPDEPAVAGRTDEPSADQAG